MAKTVKPKSKRLKPISLQPLKPEEALWAALETPLHDDQEHGRKEGKKRKRG